MSQVCDADTIIKFGSQLRSIKKFTTISFGNIGVQGDQLPQVMQRTNQALNKHYQQLVNSINQQQQCLICHLDLVINNPQWPNNSAERSVIALKNGKLSISLRLLYESGASLSDLKSVLGPTADGDSENQNKAQGSLMMPIVYSVNINLSAYNWVNWVEEIRNIPTTHLRYILSSCHHLTNVCIMGMSALGGGFYKFISELFDDVHDDNYINTPAKFTSFKENSTPTVDHLTRATLDDNLDIQSPELLGIISKSLYNIQDLDEEM